jgi:hypothetical protein
MISLHFYIDHLVCIMVTDCTIDTECFGLFIPCTVTELHCTVMTPKSAPIYIYKYSRISLVHVSESFMPLHLLVSGVNNLLTPTVFSVKQELKFLTYLDTFQSLI